MYDCDAWLEFGLPVDFRVIKMSNQPRRDLGQQGHVGLIEGPHEPHDSHHLKPNFLD
jgi:hypothetical protein